MSTYVFDNAWELERERLSGLEARLDPSTTRYLDAIGVGPGWTCLEVGGGGGSITQWLCRRVGPTGRIVATDLDTRFLDALEEPCLEVHCHNVVTDELPEDSFDLIHSRLVLEHLPDREIVLKRLVASVRPGGWLLIEDADFRGITSKPPMASIYPTSDQRSSLRVWRAVVAVMEKAGYDATFGPRLPGLFLDNGLEEVGAEACSSLWQGGSPSSAAPRWTLERLREGLVASKLITERDIDRQMKRFTDPEHLGLIVPIVSVWGRRPVSGGTPSNGKMPARSSDLRDRLAGLALFDGCTSDQLAKIAAQSRETSFDAGTVVTREGESGDLFYVIVQGGATVSRGGERLAVLGPGSFFGETALLTGGPRTATVTADTRLIAAGLDKQAFDGLVNECPPVSRRILEGVAERASAASSFP